MSDKNDKMSLAQLIIDAIGPAFGLLTPAQRKQLKQIKAERPVSTKASKKPGPKPRGTRASHAALVEIMRQHEEWRTKRNASTNMKEECEL